MALSPTEFADHEKRDHARDRYIAREWKDGDLMDHFGNALSEATWDEITAIGEALRRDDAKDFYARCRRLVERYVEDEAKRRYP